MHSAPLIDASVITPVAAPTTKLKPPKLPAQLLVRPALLQRLAAWQAHRLSVLTAPAGYGKTTLAAAALQDAAANLPAFHSAWLALDEDDDDPVRFVHGLSAALMSLIPDAARAAALVATGQQQPRQALHLLLAALEQQPAKVLIVLDDYHRLQTPDVHQLLSLAIERSPEHVHWMVLSRHAAPFSLGRLRLHDQVLELDSQDLRLDRIEIEELLLTRSELHLDPVTVALLEERTQGWMAGLLLSLLSLGRRSGGREGQGSEDKLLRHLRGDVTLLMEYVSSEVLNQLDPALRSFLLQCSILERLQPSLCEAVTGVDDSPRLLMQAVEQQLFLRRVDTEDEWYELHHLFRDLLQHSLRQGWPAAQVQTLHRRAADWWLAHDDMVAALRALLAGGAAGLAAELVQTRSHAALLSNYLDELRHWFELLPRAEIDARPRLLLDKTWLSFLLPNTSGFVADVAHAHSVLAHQPGVPAPERDELAALEFLQQFYGTERPGMHDKVLAAAAQFDPASHLARGWAHVVALLLKGQSPGIQVNTYFEQIHDSFRSAGFTRGEIYITALQTAHLQGRGEAAGVLEMCSRGLKLSQQASRHEPGDVLFFTFTAGEMLYWQDRLPEAALSFERTLAQAQIYRDPEFTLLASIGLDLCAAGSSLSAAAPAAGTLPGQTAVDEEKLWDELDASYTLAQRAAIVNWQMWRCLKARSPQAAWHQFQRLGVSLESLPVDAPDATWLALLTAYVARGRQLAQLSEPLERLIQRCLEEPRLHVAIQAQLLRVWQLQQLGRRDTARTVLRQALRKVEQTGYVRMVLDQPDLLRLLQGTTTSFVHSLLLRIEDQDRPAAEVRLTAQELEILRLLAQGLSTAQVAEQLVVTASTVYWHLSVLQRKLGVKNRAQALAYMRKRGAI